MSYLTVPDGKDPLAHRSEMTAEYGFYAYDMMKTSWACSSCGSEVAPPAPMVVPFANYQSLATAHQTIAQAAESAISSGGEHAPCAKCGAPSRLSFLDLYMFHSGLGSDLVLRHTPSAAPQLFRWSLATGPSPMPWGTELDAVILRDAMLRTIRGKKDQGEDEEGLALLGVAAKQLPGEPELLKYLPWVMKNGESDLGAAIAQEAMARDPQNADALFWSAQVIVEDAANQRMPQAEANRAVPLLERAISIRSDFPDAQIALANVSRILRRDDLAESALRALLANHPEHPEANYTLGLVLLAKNPAEALTCFERGEKAAPEDADYPRSRARALIALGRTDEARTAANRARQLAPNDRRIDQVMSEIASNNPTAKTASLVIKGVVALVLVGVVVLVIVIVLGAMKSATPPTPPAAAATSTTKSPATPTPATPPAAKKK